ncbi:peptidylprolyl isomerase [Pseudaestuariivita sp.]|uniref:peptidylprolyl isomerase n=1 Tax=Pseudaestuariivita sp. TaxID=2211669 RepID=UPI004059E671
MTRLTAFLTSAALVCGGAAWAQTATTEAETETNEATTEAPAAEMVTPSADLVVATVNGTDITLGHLIMIRVGLPQEYQSLGDDVLFQGILDQLVQQAAVASDLGDDLPLRVEIALDNERRSILAAEALEQVAADAVTDEAVQAAYDAAYANAPAEQEFNASHILVETEEEAQALIEELNGGADFAELAKEHSTGPSGPGGGLLGWFGKGAMVPPFEAAVVAMEAGGVSAPVQTQFGWHVVKLNEVRDLPKPELDAVRAELANTLRQEAIQAHLTAKTEAAEVTRIDMETIDPAAISRRDLLED